MNQLVLEKKFLTFMMDVKRKLKSDILDRNMEKETLGSLEVKYIAALKDTKQLFIVEEIAKKYEYIRTHWIGSPIIDALYIDSDDFRAIFLAVRDEYKSLESEKYNYGNDSKICNEIQNAIIKENIKSLSNYTFDTTVNILYAIELAIAAHHGISMDEMEYIKMSNTQKEFVKYYHLYRTDPKQIEAHDFCNHDHIKSFSLNYYAMVKVMSDIYKSEENTRGFTVHDAGTNTSQLALMLSTLKEDELMQLKVNEIIASDLLILNSDQSLRYTGQFHDSKQIRFVEQDFCDESKELPEADVTILFDVLEHFPTEESSFHIMERFWNRTRKLLIVHVPFEEVPDAQWGHYITFNKLKLSRWAERLPDSLSLGDAYSFTDNVKYSDYGFLILKRTFET